MNLASIDLIAQHYREPKGCHYTEDHEGYEVQATHFVFTYSRGYVPACDHCARYFRARGYEVLRIPARNDG